MKAKPWLSFQVIVASLLANVLALASSIYVIQILNRFVTYGVTTTLVTLTVGVILAIVFELSFRWVRLQLAEGLSEEPDRNNSIGAFGLLTTARIEALSRVAPGERRTLVQGLEAVEQSLGPANFTALIDLPFSLVFLGTLYLLSTPLGIVVTLFMLMVITLGLISRFRLKPKTERLRELAGNAHALLGTASVAADSVRLFGGARRLVDDWTTLNDETQGLRRHVGKLQGITQTLGQSAQALMSVAVIAIGALLVLDGQLDTGAMIGANILAARALAPVQRFAQLGESLTKAQDALTRVREFAAIETEPEQGSALKQYKGSLQFDDVALQLPGQNQPLFEGLSFKLEPGEILAVIGRSGAGKTTLSRMMVGLVAAERGKILVDGVALPQLLPDWWRRQLIYLPQELQFLNVSLRANLTSGDEDVDEQRLAEALEASGSDLIVNHLPNGLDTEIRGGGSEFSVGERRRLGLARALYRDGRLVVLDEPSEGLDEEGIKQVFEVMVRLSREGKTLVVCSHDPRVIAGATRILDLNSKPVPELRSAGQAA